MGTTRLVLLIFVCLLFTPVFNILRRFLVQLYDWLIGGTTPHSRWALRTRALGTRARSRAVGGWGNAVGHPVAVPTPRSRSRDSVCVEWTLPQSLQFDTVASWVPLYGAERRLLQLIREWHCSADTVKS
jgi:hypothetical protein